MSRLITPLCLLALLISPCIAQDAEYKPPRKWTFGSMGIAMRADLEVFQGGARDEAGEIVIKEKDRLLKWNGTELKTLDDFCRQLYASKPGDIIEVEISRPKAEGDERENLTVKIKLADPKVAYKELYTNLDKRTRSYDWRENEAVTKGGPLRDKLWPRIEKHKLTGQWDNLLAAHERELDLWDSYENLSSTDLLLSDPLAAHRWIEQASGPLAALGSTGWREGFVRPIGHLLDGNPKEISKTALPKLEEEKTEVWKGRADVVLGSLDFLKEHRALKEFEQIRTQVAKAEFAWRGEPGFEESASLVSTLRALGIDTSEPLNAMPAATEEIAREARTFHDTVQAGKILGIPTDVDPSAFVEGEVVCYHSSFGLIAIGGKERNVWRGGPNAPAVILDLGGDDDYVDCATTRFGHSVSIVIDWKGNDHYHTGDRWGVAAGVLGFALINDNEGNDTYEAPEWGVGAAFGGIGLIIDGKGNDRYLGGTNSIGCAAYGIGGVIDITGNDVYDSHTMSVGVGQPGGVGFVLDHAGDDRYRCNGEEPSGYGTEGEWTGWGIGCGFGWRTLACGGIGLVVDVKGNDIYDAGEFGLGCGYFMAIGAVRDMDGDDIYHSSRYGLAAAAHAGVGLFMDDKGNDTYEGKTAASIGGVWDIVTGYFYDGAGDDNYRCDGLGLGACAQNGFGIFWDAGGADNYRGSASTIGNAGSAEYGGGRLAKNFGIFMDSGGGKDNYPRDDRKNGTELVEQEYAIFWDE